MKVKFTDNSDDILYKFAKAKERGLEAIGLTAERYAKKELRDFPYVDTGNLMNSITNAVKGSDVYIGTNVKYAMWLELGTGIYASDGQGRKEPWAYQDEEGEWHFTRGVKPAHYLKKAATEHSDEYKELMSDSMKNA